MLIFVQHFKLYMNTVIIVAGGRGKRMQKTTPKQFLILGGMPVLMRTINCFYNYDNSIRIILVLPKDEISTWEKLCVNYKFETAHTIVEGGEERFYSVQNALKLVGNNQLVAIHDGVRPFVSNTTIQNCFSQAEINGSAIPVVSLAESLRYCENEINKSVNRLNYKRVQTPQVFKSEIILAAYTQPFSNEFTDDASVVEKMGYHIHTISGNEENIKITTPLDMLVGEALVKNISRYSISLKGVIPNS